VSDAAGSSEMAGLEKLFMGDAPRETGGDAGSGAEGGPESVDGGPNSGVGGLGTKIVFRTSRRPRIVLARFDGAACCCKESVDVKRHWKHKHTLRSALATLSKAVRASESSS
jgi:hypothetical protein